MGSVGSAMSVAMKRLAMTGHEKEVLDVALKGSEKPATPTEDSSEA